MKILFSTDSRGVHGTTHMDPTHPDNNSWPNLLMKKYPEHEYTNRRAGWGELRPLTTLYDFDPYIRDFPDKHFDIIFIQNGMNIGIDYCTPGVFNALVKQHYTEDGLKYENLHDNRKKYVYIHTENERQIFELLKEKSHKVVFVGLHSMARWHLELRQGREWNPTYVELAKIQNDSWSKMATDYLDLPDNEAWVDTNCREDFLHYNAAGTQYIMERAEVYL